ncbi:hypothetical protein IW492_08450 [Enterococcus sp. BWB1-3]|uniref:hypothetical protein n=1 Tax=unclassified Enterococcus TaxID=2608891 RepID=UPI001923FD38|nr:MULTISPECIES: hypothetical protein [unclassified Enterococcus]MBL1229262.1 hypothetical protein [Enterococcus sp. BWB1-3]MCB5951752.1 hypothetical protein [Enterococcus sp. BWT-B8]
MKKIWQRFGMFTIMILFGAVIGRYLGYSVGSGELTGREIFQLLLLTVIFYIIHIVIHEAGHGLFGFLTGYKLVSYRIFSFIWIWQENGKVIFRRQKVPGTLGQCLMSPPAYQRGKYPFRLYLMGGVMVNLIATVIAGIFFAPVSLWGSCFVVVGLFIIVTNGIPMGFNDGMSIMLASASEEQQYLLYLQFEVNDQMMKGKTYRELPDSYFSDVPEIPKRTYFNDYLSFLQVGRALDCRQWRIYKTKLEEIWRHKEDIISLYQIELKKELLFCLCIFGEKDVRISQLWEDKDVQMSLKQSSMGNCRVTAAYYYYIEKKKDEALKQLENGQQLLIKAPNPGDGKMELQLNQWLSEQIMENSQGVFF